ncbi:methyltransferase type 12 [Methanosarcinales archaeon]|nr:MAG: methyltransferase type 12 [Methanosarcinales archaeon]
MKVLDTIPEIGSEPLDKIGKGCEALHILFTAFDFDLFNLLEEPKTARQISGEIVTNPYLTEKFLNALVALQLLAKHDGRYTNTKLASTFLVNSSPFYQGNLLRLSAKGSDNWSKMSSILKGEIQKEEDGKFEFEDVFDPTFILAMAEGAMRGSLHRTVKEVSTFPEFHRARKLLDLGGGHGLYAIAFSQINPNLEAVVFDLPQVTEVAKEFIAKYEIEERVKIIGGNFLEDDIGNGYDIVFVSDVFYRKKDVLMSILKKIHDALNDNGSIVLKHWLLNDDRTAPLVSVLFDLKLSLRGDRHHIYTEKEYIELLYEVGFSSIRTFDISSSSSPSMIITGKKGV